MYKILIIIVTLLSFINLINCCPVATDRPLTEEREENYKYPWVVVIIDDKGPSIFPAVGYGALIKPDLVMTSAKIVAGREIEDFRVVADCCLSTELCRKDHCTIEEITKITYSDDIDQNNIKDKDWALLHLSKPMSINIAVSTIGSINLDDIDNYNLGNCVVNHWVYMDNEERDETGMITITYHVSLDNETFGMNKEDEITKLPNDLDPASNMWKPDNSLHSILTKKISFLGSPIACPVKSDPNQYVLAGFSTIVYEVDVFPDPETNVTYYEILDGTINDFRSLPDITP